MHKSCMILLAGILCLLLIASGCTNTSPPASGTTTTPGTTPPVPSPEIPSWSGTWNTTWLERDWQPDGLSDRHHTVRSGSVRELQLHLP